MNTTLATESWQLILLLTIGLALLTTTGVHLVRKGVLKNNRKPDSRQEAISRLDHLLKDKKVESDRTSTIIDKLKTLLRIERERSNKLRALVEERESLLTRLKPYIAVANADEEAKKIASAAQELLSKAQAEADEIGNSAEKILTEARQNSKDMLVAAKKKSEIMVTDNNTAAGKRASKGKNSSLSTQLSKVWRRTITTKCRRSAYLRLAKGSLIK